MPKPRNKEPMKAAQRRYWLKKRAELDRIRRETGRRLSYANRKLPEVAQ